jgi:ferric-dicitrate binding protein FerR (iron transport regulator)
LRYLELEGEAYFEVAHDSNRPFIVETGNIMTTALGTSFNIRNYPEENSISVSLISGKVRVNDNMATNELFLKPLEQIKFSRYNRQLKMIQLDQDMVSIWKDGILRFKRSSFDHVITTLERTYDVSIDTSTYSHGPWSYSGSFNNMSLEIVLTRIGYSEGFDFEIEGNKILITNES